MEKEKSKKGLIGILIVIIVLLVCVVGYLLFGNKLLNNKNDDTTTKNDNGIINKDELINKIIIQNNLQDMNDIINENKEFFLKFANAVLNNTNLENYRDRIFDLYFIIGNKTYLIDEEYFINSLSKLKIEEKENLNAHGLYYSGQNRLEIDSTAKEIDPDAFYNVLYHELLHYLDDNIQPSKYDNKYPLDYYLCNDSFYTFQEYKNLDSSVKNICINLEYKPYNETLVEGGAESISHKYFNNGFMGTYGTYVARYELLNILLGEDDMYKVFFSRLDYKALYKLLVLDKGVDSSYLYSLFKVMDQSDDSFDNFAYADAVIDIYEDLYNKKLFEDDVFRYAVYSLLYYKVDDNVFGGSKRAVEYKNNYSSFKNLIKDIKSEIGYGKYKNNYSHQILLHKGNYNIYMVLSDFNQDPTHLNIRVHYDFNNKKIIDKEVRDL